MVPWQVPRFEEHQGARRVPEQYADRRLLKAIHGEMEPLWNAFGGPRWALFCVNTQGVVVDARQSIRADEPAIRPLTVGRDLSETMIGTTAPACVICDGVETIVDGNQHFLAQFESLFCLSVPLRGLDGEVVGALDITGRGERDIDMLRQHFQYASLSIEARMMESLGHCHLLRLQADPRWLTTPLAGVIAVEEDGHLRAISQLGRRILGLPVHGSVRALALDALFPHAMPAQRRRFLMHAATPQRIPRADGSHIWVQHVRSPVRGLRFSRDINEPTAAALPLVDPDWREQGLRAIGDVVRMFDGNVAAAARHLRMSRTTLYARIRELRGMGLL
jgi:transcriptional regulator of acetoin/glycerol metabolism